MSNESFANFDFSGFNGVLNGSDFNQVKENASDRVVEKRDMSGGKNFIGAVNKFVAENLEKQAKETRKALNPEKYEKEERAEKLNQIKGTLEEKQKDLFEAKKKLSSSKTIRKTKKKQLEMKINCLQTEIWKLKMDKRDIEIKMDSFSYGYYDAKSREDAAYNMDYQKFDDGTPNHVENSEQRISKLECVNKRLRKYINLFNKDDQQDNRRGEQSR